MSVAPRTPYITLYRCHRIRFTTASSVATMNKGLYSPQPYPGNRRSIDRDIDADPFVQSENPSRPSPRGSSSASAVRSEASSASSFTAGNNQCSTSDQIYPSVGSRITSSKPISTTSSLPQHARRFPADITQPSPALTTSSSSHSRSRSYSPATPSSPSPLFFHSPADEESVDTAYNPHANPEHNFRFPGPSSHNQPTYRQSIGNAFSRLPFLCVL